MRFVLAVLCASGILIADLRFSAFDDARSVMSTAVAPFRYAGEAPARTAAAVADYFRSRNRLLDEKRSLEEELLRQKVQMRSLDFFLDQNRSLRQLLNLRDRVPGNWMAADMRHEISRLQAGRLGINRGLNDGAAPGMAVVDENGVVGQIVRAEGGSSEVNLIVNPDYWLAARVRRTGQLAILRGIGGAMEIYSMPGNSDLRAGDELVADGGVYPPGYPAGTVGEVSRGVRYLSARVSPASDLYSRRTLLIYKSRQHARPSEAGEP